mmetsp:Transcript_111040/g.215078  ORF Transcript_111040/g.215078 Transcript_111040/m.215078 type:complete len:100 (-) Transcript_111040:55-354(-)
MKDAEEGAVALLADASLGQAYDTLSGLRMPAPVPLPADEPQMPVLPVSVLPVQRDAGGTVGSTVGTVAAYTEPLQAATWTLQLVYGWQPSHLCERTKAE